MQRNVVLFKDGSNLTSDYQVAQGLTSDAYSGYIAPTGTWFGGVHNGAYYFITGWIEKTFTSGFASVMPAWQSIKRIADEQGLREVSAMATIVKVEAMHRVADAYGPIPYNNYGSGNLQVCTWMALRVCRPSYSSCQHPIARKCFEILVKSAGLKKLWCWLHSRRFCLSGLFSLS